MQYSNSLVSNLTQSDKILCRVIFGVYCSFLFIPKLYLRLRRGIYILMSNIIVLRSFFRLLSPVITCVSNQNDLSGTSKLMVHSVDNMNAAIWCFNVDSVRSWCQERARHNNGLLLLLLFRVHFKISDVTADVVVKEVVHFFNFTSFTYQWSLLFKTRL
jgi:hypothetical protein